MAKANAKASSSQDSGVYIITYFLTWLTGILVYLFVAHGNKRLKLHSMQAIILGIIGVVLFFIPFLGWILAVLLWLYGLYIGFEAFNGKDLSIPYITDFLKNNPEFK